MLTEFDLGRVKQAYLLTKNVSEVARVTGFSRSTVARAIARNCRFEGYKQRAVSKRVLDRRRALRSIVDRTTKKQHREWPTHSSSRQIASAYARKTGIVVSPRQIRRDLNDMGLKAYRRPGHATRIRREVRAKVEFARRNRNTDWRRIVFSDESWLCSNERTGRFHWRKARKHVLPMEKKARWNVASIMVWGCVGYNWKSPLVIFPSKTSVDGELKQFRLDAASYVKRCLSTVSKDLVKDKRLFQQDGARSHAAKSTKEYLAKKGVELLDPWPPYSPELNAIERVWKELNARVGERCPMSVPELIAATKEAWEEIPQEVINAHCQHFRTQLDELDEL